MAGWLRNNRKAALAADPAVAPPDRSHEDWRTLPPPPTVLRTLVPTVAVDAFSDNLSTRHDPSFLAELSHHVDSHGPTGLVTGLASASTVPQPLTRRPHELAARADGAATVQRSVTSWRQPSATRSPLITASGVDLVPISLRTISADAAEPGPSTDASVVTSQAPEGGGSQAPALASVDDAEERTTHPLVSHREPDDATAATAQREVQPNPTATPQRRRLGLGAPLSDPPPTVARAAQQPQPVVARSELTAESAGRVVDQPRVDYRAPGLPSGTERELSVVKPAAEGPLTRGPESSSRVVMPSISPTTSAIATGTRPVVGRPTVQRAPTALRESAGNLDLRSSAPARGYQPPAEPRLEIVQADEGANDETSGPRDLRATAVQRLPSDSADSTSVPRPADVAPLVGQRPRPRILDRLPVARTSSPSGANAEIPQVSRHYHVQRSIAARAPVGEDAIPGPAAVHWQPPSGYSDPGEVAVSRGLARRDHDGSVVFNFSPAPDLGAAFARSSAPVAESVALHPVGSFPDTVQRHAAESPDDGAEPDTAAAATVQVSSASRGPAPAVGGPAAAASTAAAPGLPLEELARQLFGPLSARLKAELRLDRERVGLLTDLRQ